jgi:predicted DCC family thiol-disulfide oxidoreductase YuxK
MKVLLFDGVCNLCNAWVNWVIDHDKKNLFKFAALQSAFGQQRVKDLNLEAKYLDTVILDDEGKVYTESDVALEVARHIGGVYTLAVALYIFPRFIRNFVYRIIARNRYRWFGKQESCRVPTPELKAKFLD